MRVMRSTLAKLLDQSLQTWAFYIRGFILSPTFTTSCRDRECFSCLYSKYVGQCHSGGPLVIPAWAQTISHRCPFCDSHILEQVPSLLTPKTYCRRPVLSVSISVLALPSRQTGQSLGWGGVFWKCRVSPPYPRPWLFTEPRMKSFQVNLLLLRWVLILLNDRPDANCSS